MSNAYLTQLSVTLEGNCESGSDLTPETLRNALTSSPPFAL